jgi:lipoprotein-releasing system permease protein
LTAVLGIAMGVAALIVALALANGFRDEMREKILQGTSHLTVLRKDGSPIDKHFEIPRRVRQLDGVVSASTTTYDGAIVSGSKKEAAYAVLRGIEREQSAQVQPWIINGTVGPLFDSSNTTETTVPQAIVGAELAAKIGVAVGDSIDALPLYGGLTNRPARRLRVAGIFRSGLFEYDTNWIYVALETTTVFAGDNHAGSVISVQVNNADNVKQIAANVLNTLGNDYTAIDWQQANQPLFAALALERRMGAFIVGLIVAIAVLNITTMLILVVVERRRDIAILRTLGATRTGVMLVFMIEGAVVGAIGAIAGVLVGLAACLIGNRFKLVSLPADVYSITNVPFNATAKEVVLAALIAFGLSVLATIYPARNAARLRPVEVLRDA